MNEPLLKEEIEFRAENSLNMYIDVYVEECGRTSFDMKIGIILYQVHYIKIKKLNFGTWIHTTLFNYNSLYF